MKKFSFVLATLGILILTNSVFAAGLAPQIATDPTGGQAVKLEVGNVENDSSWIWIPLAGGPIDTSLHEKVTVSFDIYRYQGEANGGMVDHNLFWHWVDASDNSVRPLVPNSPSWGAQWDMNNKTYPFGWGPYASITADTIYGSYANIKLEWDFKNQLAAAYYNNILVADNVIIGDSIDKKFAGFDITLYHGSATGAGNDIAWIDNFVITGSDIYNSYGFERFNSGAVNGQDGWIAGTETGVANPSAVPEPTTMFLFGLGLAGMSFFRKK